MLLRIQRSKPIKRIPTTNIVNDMPRTNNNIHKCNIQLARKTQTKMSYKTTIKIDITHDEPINQDKLIDIISRGKFEYKMLEVRQIKTKKIK